MQQDPKHQRKTTLIHPKNQPHKLIIAHQNIDGLQNKIERLTHFLHNSNPDLIILSEHGLNQEKLENTRIKGFRLIGGFSRQHYRKGGVAVYANLNFSNKITVTSVSNRTAELICETIMLKLELKQGSLHLLGVYRPPNGNLNTAIDILSSELDKIAITDNPILVMGDINVDNLVDSNEKINLNEMLQGYGISRLHLPPTRITNHSQTSIDFICTNTNESEVSSQVLTTGLSDHTAQICTISTGRTNHSCIQSKKRQFSERTVEELRRNLQAQDWSQVILTENVETAYNMFSKILQYAMNIACPLKIVKNKRSSRKNIWDAESQALKKSYLKALNRELITGHLDDKEETARRKKAYDLKLKTLRKQINSDLVERSDNKSKAIWNVINNERKEKSTKMHIEQLKVEDITLDSPTDIANHLNNFFATTADRTLKEINRGTASPAIEPNHQPQIPRLTFFETNEQEVGNIIDSLKAKTSAGEDEISSKLIKQCKNEVISSLTSIINKSLAQGICPSELKIAKIYPKYKNGATNNATSYRPISLISSFSKILERVILNRLLEHLTQHHLLTPRQHGFLKDRSTSTAIAQLTETVIGKLEKGHIATSILLDFSKAFDCLDHKIIINKLQSLGVSGRELDWFKSYLSNRTQRVELTHTVNNTVQKVKSEQLPVTRGVPQGSVLGPVLYILLTNDFPRYLQNHCEIVMYADDTALIIANKNKDQLDIDSFVALNMAKQYCYLNDLVLNESKTQQIIFTATQNNYEGLPEITTVRSGKYLGLTIDQNLSWELQIDQLCHKLNSSLYAVRRLKKITNLRVAMIAYYSLFESYLRYGLVAWGGTTTSNLHRVLVIQKRAIRTLKGLGPLDTCRTSFKELGILTVVGLYIQETILFAIKTGQTRTGDRHHYNTRHGANFLFNQHHLSLSEKKPTYRGAMFFNILPDSLKNLPEKIFKTSLKTWLLERPVYTIQEFMQWRTLNP